MENFVYNVKTKIIFGRNTEDKIADEIKLIVPNGKVLLHYGGGSIKKNGLYDKVIAQLRLANIEFVELGGVQPNPRLALAQEGIKICQEQNIDFILAVGGGSVIDSAKCIAVGAVNEENFWQKYYVERQEVTKALPIGTVLTIPAAGSESSGGSVITDEVNERKIYANGDVLRPEFSILNPELSYTLPKYQIACGAADILAHIMERYFSNSVGVDFTDQLCEAAMKSLIKNAPEAIVNPLNYDVRAEVMLAGLYAHSDCLGVGRVGDWATHDIEHELSAIYDIAHGEGLAIMFPAWMKFVGKNNPHKVVQFAENVLDITLGTEEEKIAAAITTLKNWFKLLGLKNNLREFSEISQEKFQLMAKRCTPNGTLGNYVELTTTDIFEIFSIAW
ncbi:iron-containing alcohol dehydrogenase [Lentisphaerota bacterium WC36G]|nr:iron-containing alcohol dehydrogenase [Lentisphaerae bacterium WC36]